MPEHDELTALLRSLKLPAMAETFAAVALRAAREGWTHEQFLYELVVQERQEKDQRRIERLLAQSGLPREKTFQTLQLDRYPLPIRQHLERLRRGGFVTEAVNVVAVGKPGTGKSHLAAALGHELIQLGRSVYFAPTYALVQRLLDAKRALRLPHELAKLDRFECLILDDIGYVQQDRDEMEVLFTLLAERYERRTTVITTNLIFSEWDQIFKNPMTTLAAIDRVVHHSVILDLMALDSYRNMQAKKRTEGDNSGEAA